MIQTLWRSGTEAGTWPKKVPVARLVADLAFSRGFLKWFLFLLIPLLSIDAQAIPVTIVRLEGPLVMSVEQTTKLVNEVMDIYKEAGVKLTPRLLFKTTDRPIVYEFSSFSYLPHLRGEFPGLFRHREPVHFLSEALWDRYHALQYFVGYSFPIQRKSVSSAQEFTSYGENFHNISVAAAAHEIGHDLGATHVHDCSLMDTNILHCVRNGGEIFWGIRAKKELKRAVTRWRLKKF